METRKTSEKGTGFGWLPALAGLLVGAAGCVALILLCCEPANGGPVTWGFILGTKVGGVALLLIANWAYGRLVKDGGHGDDDRA